MRPLVEIFDHLYQEIYLLFYPFVDVCILDIIIYLWSRCVIKLCKIPGDVFLVLPVVVGNYGFTNSLQLDNGYA